jgi:uncharacterized membrane protein YfcA
MFRSRIFTCWFIGALVVWLGLFVSFSDLAFLRDHWFYPAIMVLGAFVAGLTPEGGGAVAFPVLNVFFNIDRVLARDFSLMIQSIGMTSASIFILTHKRNVPSTYMPLLWMIPVCFIGFVIGMQTLQQIPVYIIQALFLSLITTFAIAYYFSSHRGSVMTLEAPGRTDKILLTVILVLGGMCASLFGTGADIILYTLLVTRFRMNERIATHLSIMIMAAMSVLGYAYRHFYDQGLTAYQVKTWLSAYPVVLFMAPFGAYVLSRLPINWMLRGIILLNVGQLVYFNFNNPALGKFVASFVFTVALGVAFQATLSRMTARNSSLLAGDPVKGTNAG